MFSCFGAGGEIVGWVCKTMAQTREEVDYLYSEFIYLVKLSHHIPSYSSLIARLQLDTFCTRPSKEEEEPEQKEVCADSLVSAPGDKRS